MSDVAEDFRRQLPSMIGMAGMFVATIFLAMYIRPWYDKAGLQAFGEAGSSQLRFIFLELLMIFIFTAAILLLAKYKKEWVIKYGIMGILFIALLYASIPLAHQILVDDSVTPFEYESTEETEATYLTEIGMDQYLDTIRSNQSGELVNTIRLMQWGVDEPIWSTDILHGNVSYEFSELIVVPGPDWVTINTGAVINTLSLTDGSIVSTYDCFYYDNQGDLRPMVEVGCILATEIEDALYIVDAGERLHRFNIDRDNYPNQLSRQQKQATWQLPPDMKAVDVLVEAELLSDTSLLIVSEEYAGVVRLNQTAGFPEGGIYEPAHILIEASSEAGFTSADVGYSNLLKVPMNESTTGEQLIVLGTADGDIHSWSFEPTDLSLIHI